MPSYLDPARFRWAFFADNFLFPFDTQQLESRNPDQKLNLPLERKLLARNLKQANLEKLPEDFVSYLTFVTAIVEADKAAGGAGMKFESVEQLALVEAAGVHGVAERGAGMEGRYKREEAAG